MLDTHLKEHTIVTEFLSSLIEADNACLLAINGWHAPWADTFMYAFSGKWIWIPLYASLLYVIGRNLRWQVAVGCAVAIALTIVFADQVGASLIRPEVARLRPSNLENPLSEMVHIVNGYRGGSYGFPSCHAANTFGLAFFVVYLFRSRLLSTFILVWALVTCYSRAYLGVHYPGDLLAGAVLGFVGASLCYGLFQKICRYKRPERPMHLWVPVAVGGATVVGMLVYAFV
ncbi:phosphatase PAP2 family protein [uncultured Mediterranea sp.]|uniref:phosphatase PAP2 family protein n=1 Tax=uncultured Mediterranea sp. TaxID=1926662 RepID=UPI0025854621|nr:phosphatase PAP2 family protein [uncultured Mediterranea sp.]